MLEVDRMVRDRGGPRENLEAAWERDRRWSRPEPGRACSCSSVPKPTAASRARTRRRQSWKVRSARDRTIRTIRAIRIPSKFRNFPWKIQKFQKIWTFSKNIGEIPIKFHQNLSKNHLKEKNREFLQNFAEKCEKVWRKFSEILRSERCKSM